MLPLVPRIAPRSPRQMPTVETPQADVTIVCRETASLRPVDSVPRAAAVAVAVALVHLRPALVWVGPHRAVTHGIDRGVEAAMAILVHRIGPAAIRP
jgi:hypothetical protein